LITHDRSFISVSSLLSSSNNSSAGIDAVHFSSPFIKSSAHNSTSNAISCYAEPTDYTVSALLIEDEFDHHQSQPISPRGVTSTFTDGEFFDLDIEAYYANGNNACGFIPGAPLILNTDGPNVDEAVSEGFDSTEMLTGSQGLNPSSLSEKTKEYTALLQHFVEVIAPSYV
jgi:hypothetical protein